MAPPKHDKDLENLVLERSSHIQVLLQKSRQSIKASKGLSRDKFWRAVEKRSPKNAKKHQ